MRSSLTSAFSLQDIFVTEYLICSFAYLLFTMAELREQSRTHSCYVLWLWQRKHGILILALKAKYVWRWFVHPESGSVVLNNPNIEGSVPVQAIHFSTGLKGPWGSFLTQNILWFCIKHILNVYFSMDVRCWYFSIYMRHRQRDFTQTVKWSPLSANRKDNLVLLHRDTENQQYPRDSRGKMVKLLWKSSSIAHHAAVFQSFATYVCLTQNRNIKELQFVLGSWIPKFKRRSNCYLAPW